MHRFYIETKNISANSIIINDKKQSHHIRDVLRLLLNDKVTVFDEQGNEYDCVIEAINDTVRLNVKNICAADKNAKTVKLTIACAIPKKSNMSDIIDKLTQLGVDRIIPLKTERVIVRLDKNKEASLLERWNRVALSASLQSQRNALAIVNPVTDIKKVLVDSDGYDLKLIPTLSGKRKTLQEAITGFKYKNILVLIGPEGDFTDEEVNSAKKNGFIPVSLGALVLRVETAAVSVASFIKLYLSDK